MTASDLPDTLLKLGLALAKHHIKNVIGDEALEIAASTLTDVGGEKVQAKVDSIFASKEGQKELLKAAKILIAEGFTVLPYCSDDVIVCKKLDGKCIYSRKSPQFIMVDEVWIDGADERWFIVENCFFTRKIMVLSRLLFCAQWWLPLVS